jgi:hypothetical protein
MGLMIHTIGIARVEVKIGLANLAYNIRRYVWLSGRLAPVVSQPPLAGIARLLPGRFGSGSNAIPTKDRHATLMPPSRHTPASPERR